MKSDIFWLVSCRLHSAIFKITVNFFASIHTAEFLHNLMIMIVSSLFFLFLIELLSFLCNFSRRSQYLFWVQKRCSRENRKYRYSFCFFFVETLWTLSVKIISESCSQRSINIFLSELWVRFLWLYIFWPISSLS